MPRNTIKSFPTARLRRGLAHIHPLCAASTVRSPEPRDPNPPRRGEVPPGAWDPEPGDPARTAPVSGEPQLVPTVD